MLPVTWSPRVIVQLLVFIVLVPCSPVLITGRWGWWEAWVYAGLSVISFVASRALAARRHPDLLEERAKSLEHEDTAPYDRILAPLVGLGGLMIPVVAGLQARFAPAEPFTLAVKASAIVLIVLGYGFSSWALVENRFFSGTMRIQDDRGHVVVDSGPYRVVRHPGYAGMLLGIVAAPLLLDSPWAYGAAGFLLAITILRTALEDRTLQAKLPGYTDYAKRTRYRLLPGIW